MIIDTRIVKFLRCPKCDGYTLECKNAEVSKNIVAYCKNCKKKFVLKGDKLSHPKTTDSGPAKIQSIHKIKSKTNFAPLIIFFLMIILGGIIILLNNNKKDSTAEDSIKSSTQSMQKKAQFEEKNMDKNELLTKIADQVKPAKSQEKESVSEKPVKNQIIKVFDNEYIKVRKSRPDTEEPFFRWYFKKTIVSLSRTAGQRVFISGGPKGTEKWCVDNEIQINRARIKGCVSIMERTGAIPEDKKVPPYEITNLIPVGRKVTLQVRLADYGILWGNTPIYIVIKD